MLRRVDLTAVFVGLAVAAGLGQQPPTAGTQGLRGSQQPSRDTPAQSQDAQVPKGRITGRVLAADNGRPVKRARVFISAAELSPGRGILTDDAGIFDFTDLPAGRYTMTVSKSGFVSLSYGQRRPLQAGTPLQLTDGQQLKGIEFRLPRGSVVAGHVYDESGDPMPGVMVRVMRYQYLQGDRRLTAAGTAQTDDRGQYRVWGLNPGDYYINAQARINLPFGGPGGRGGRGGPAGGPGAAIAGALGRIGGGNFAALFNDDEDQKSYAPTYYPGVTAVGEARPVTLALSQETQDVDFSLQLVHVARIAGRVSNPDGSPSTSGNVTLLGDTTLERGGQFGMNYGSRIQWDGAFSISNVPPGRYTLRARGDDTEEPQFASLPLTVGDGDLTSVTVILAAGATISGSLQFPATQSQLPDFNNVRVTAPSTEQQIGGQAQTRVDKDGTFSLGAVPSGPHLIRPNGNLRGWSLKAVTWDGRDITDTPIDLRSGQRVTNVVMTFTNQVSEINGTITNDQGTPITEYTVLAFSTDTATWRPQSRHIMTARPDQTGKYRIRGLPSGEYYMAIVDPAEQGEWFEAAYLDEHRAGAGRVSLSDGETKTHDFRVRADR